MKIKIITNLAPIYRAPLWKKLLESKSYIYEFSLDALPHDGIKQIDFQDDFFSKYKDQFRFISNLYLNRRWLVWQNGVVTQCVFESFDQIIFLADVACLSTWIASIVCRLRGKRVIFWGHGFYGNEGYLKLLFRILFYKISHRFLVYEKRAKALMINNGYSSESVFVIYNSLDYDKHKNMRNIFKRSSRSKVFSFFNNHSLPILVFVGRTTKEKKLSLIVNAVNLMNAKEHNYNLLIVGGGEEFNLLRLKAKVGIQEKFIHFTGPIYDEFKTAEYLAHSDLCVSPGNVGLTAIHSLSFGTPVLTHNNMSNQMPESESIIEGYNGCYFEENNVNSLISSINTWFVKNSDRDSVRERCYVIVDQFYNPYYQSEIFNEILI